MKTLLTAIVLVSLIGGGTASAYLTNKTNEKNEIKITTPKKANENENKFELQLNNKTTVNNETNLASNIKLINRKKEFENYNEALKATLETTMQTRVNEEMQPYNAYIPLKTTIQDDINFLIKYELTPYMALKNSTTNQKITTSIQLDLPFTDLNNPTKAKFKITELTSTNLNWATYMKQANWYSRYNNKGIFNEILSPQFEQNYTINEQVIEMELIHNKTEYLLEIGTNVKIVQNRTNYHFILVEPYLDTQLNTYELIKTTNPYLFMDINNNNKPTISGTMIPNISGYEVIDIPYIMFNILTMPFAFISTAFNLTLFPGTPYQINISNLFLTIIAIFIFIYIIKIIFKR